MSATLDAASPASPPLSQRSMLIAALLVAAAPPLSAAEPIELAPRNSGGCVSVSCTREPPPAGGNEPAAAAPRFVLNDVRLNGAQAISAQQLRERFVLPYLGREVTLADLQQLAAAIGAEYRARGFLLAQALVPVQTVQDGVVEISVIEGRLGQLKARVAPDAPITEARVRGFLAPLAVGEAVSAPAYERAMLLLSDQPGLRVTSALEQGMQPGSTDLTVEVVAAPRWLFAAEADNHGTLESGRYRFGGSARWLGPFGIGDNLDARVLLSNGNALQFGRLAYEAPVSGSGLRAGIAVSRVHYELGGRFAALDAQGKADVLDLSLNYPLIRQRRQNLFLRFGAQVKNLTDELKAVNQTVDKRTRSVSLGWAWERRDPWLGGGYWASSGAFHHGTLALLDAQSRSDDGSAVGGLQTAGAFSKLGFQVSRLQATLPNHSLYLTLGGQLASKNLDGSEKVALGGARAVRAYPSSEALVDQGLIGSVEWRWSASPQLTPYLFYDAARGRVLRDPTPFGGGPNQRSLRGYGIGASWSQPRNLSVNATLAWRANTPPALTDGGGRNPRLFVQLQKVF